MITWFKNLFPDVAPPDIYMSLRWIDEEGSIHRVYNYVDSDEVYNTIIYNPNNGRIEDELI